MTVRTNEEIVDALVPIDDSPEGKPQALLATSEILDLVPEIRGVGELATSSLAEVVTVPDQSGQLHIGRYTTALGSGLHEIMYDQAAREVTMLKPVAFGDGEVEARLDADVDQSLFDRLVQTNRTKDFQQRRQQALAGRRNREHEQQARRTAMLNGTSASRSFDVV